MIELCKICGEQIRIESGADFYHISCPRCGEYGMTDEAFDDIDGYQLTARQKANISAWLCENKGFRINTYNLINLRNLKTPSFHDRADKLMQELERRTSYIGQDLSRGDAWISAAWCLDIMELEEIEDYLVQTARLANPVSGAAVYKIAPNGWAHLEQLKKLNPESKQCFVAMWLDARMDEVYEKAIKPAIEFIEEGQTEPRYHAVKIDNVEHINDINDEIIAAIRRSRFMVCDLTGYRGGVYFEAGFAYGLGLDVIYTCRKDWTKDEFLINDRGKQISFLYDSNKNQIGVKKEGVHFDLAHRNRIEWEANKLDEFRDNLEKRIKAVIP